MSVVVSVVHSPSGRIQGNKEDGVPYNFLKNSLLTCTPDKRTSENKSEPVNANTYGEQSVAEVFEEWEEYIVDTEAIKGSEKDGNKFTQAEETVKDYHPVKKGFWWLVLD